MGPASSSREPPLPLPPAPGWGEPPLPASQCQPLFRTCQALSGLSSNTLLVSVMFMDSQMRVHIRKLGRSCQGLAEEQTCHRLGLAGGWARVFQERLADLQTLVPSRRRAPAPVPAQAWHHWGHGRTRCWLNGHKARHGEDSKASAPPFLKGIPSQAGAEHTQYPGQEAEGSEAGLGPGLEELPV